MFEQETLVPKKKTEINPAPVHAPLSPEPKPLIPEFPVEDPRQRRLMVTALMLLLLTLAGSLYRERDFWFPSDNDDADVTTTDSTTPAKTIPPVAQTEAAPAPVEHKVIRKAAAQPTTEAKNEVPAPPMTTTTTRTVLPPLQVEVVAGDTHSVVRPGNNSVRVDLQPGAPTRPANDAVTASAGNITTNAADRVQMSADTTQAVTRPVNPGYPLLARQMKVQGSVILRALIGKDGVIQNLQIVKGPAILATAAENAVRQWRFKPHYQGGEAVETEATITVNFTISTS